MYNKKKTDEQNNSHLIGVVVGLTSLEHQMNFGVQN